MRLLNCIRCHDVLSLSHIARICRCGSSRGVTLYDGINVVISGDYARVLSIKNSDYYKSTNPSASLIYDYRWSFTDFQNVKKLNQYEFDKTYL